MAYTTMSVLLAEIVAYMPYSMYGKVWSR